MNILLLANKPPYPAKDGSSLATLNMAIGLAKAGNSVKVLAISTQKHNCKPEDIPIDLSTLIDFRLVQINTRIKPFRTLINLLFSNKPYNIERFINKRYSQELDTIIKNNRFDIIQIEGLYIFPYLKLIQSLTNAPIVYRSHNIEHEIWARISTNQKNWVKAKYLSLLSKRILKLENEVVRSEVAIVSISKRDEEWFIAQGSKNQSITIPSGYLLPENQNYTGNASNDICYLGSLDWIPNQEGLRWFLGYVWPKVHDLLPNLKFNIAGRNAPDSIIDIVKKIPNVVFHGEVENAQKYLRNYSIIVIPLLSGSGMRVKIVEGMILGKAIITTTIGLEGIDAIHNQQVLVADRPEDFAKAIFDLIEQPNLKTYIAEKAAIFAKENFDNSVLTKKLESFYKKLI